MSFCIASGFARDNLVLMHDQQERRYQSEAKKIFREFELMAVDSLQAEDTLIVAFSGHGVQFKGETKN